MTTVTVKHIRNLLSKYKDDDIVSIFANMTCQETDNKTKLTMISASKYLIVSGCELDEVLFQRMMKELNEYDKGE